jgi:RNA polymerase sigma factor (sigma-70 family)
MLTQPAGPLARLTDGELVTALVEDRGDAHSELLRRFYPGLYRFLLGQGHSRQAIDAEDIAFKTFDDAKKDIRKFRGKSKLGTWIYAIAKNQATKFYSLARQYETVYDCNNPNAVAYDETDQTREVHNTAQADSSMDPELPGDDRWQFAENDDEEAQKNASGPRSLRPDYRLCTSPTAEQLYLAAEKRRILEKYLRKMTQTEQLIIRYRYFDGRIEGNKYKDGLTFKEIGRLLLKSEKAVEAAHRRALDELFVFLKFDPYFADRVGDQGFPSEREEVLESTRPATDQPTRSPQPVLAS